MTEQLLVYEVLPLEKVGPVALGMTKTQVHSAIGPPSEASNPNQCYYQKALMIEYDENETVEFIEVSRERGIAAIYQGKDIFNVKASELIDFVCQHARLDENDPELGYSFLFPELEMSLWRPVIPEDAADPEGQYFSTVGIGRRGYYSQVDA